MIDDNLFRAVMTFGKFAGLELDASVTVLSCATINYTAGTDVLFKLGTKIEETWTVESS